MAICEEIERKIVIDNVALSRFREYPSLEEILNTWVVWKLNSTAHFSQLSFYGSLDKTVGRETDYWVNQYMYYKLG